MEETMARHIPTKFLDKLHEVQSVLDVARRDEGRHFDYGREALPGVRVVRVEVRETPIALSLWTLPVDIVEVCGDAAYPATAALLAIDAGQVQALKAAGVFVDLSQLTRSDSTPGLYYALFDYLSSQQVHRVLHKVIPQLEPHDDRVLTA
jgi:hypothetical protein